MRWFRLFWVGCFAFTFPAHASLLVSFPVGKILFKSVSNNPLEQKMNVWSCPSFLSPQQIQKHPSNCKRSFGAWDPPSFKKDIASKLDRSPSDRVDPKELEEELKMVKVKLGASLVEIPSHRISEHVLSWILSGDFYVLNSKEAPTISRVLSNAVGFIEGVTSQSSGRFPQIFARKDVLRFSPDGSAVYFKVDGRGSGQDRLFGFDLWNRVLFLEYEISKQERKCNTSLPREILDFATTSDGRFTLILGATEKNDVTLLVHDRVLERTTLGVDWPQQYPKRIAGFTLDSQIVVLIHGEGDNQTHLSFKSLLKEKVRKVEPVHPHPALADRLYRAMSDGDKTVDEGKNQKRLDFIRKAQQLGKLRTVPPIHDSFQTRIFPENPNHVLLIGNIQGFVIDFSEAAEPEVIRKFSHGFQTPEHVSLAEDGSSVTIWEGQNYIISALE